MEYDIMDTYRNDTQHAEINIGHAEINTTNLIIMQSPIK